MLATLLVILLARPAFAAEPPNDPEFKNQPNLIAIRATEAWDRGKGAGTTVAVVSTGIQKSHEDLGDKVGPGFDATDDGEPTTDASGRGTHLAGIVGAKTNNSKGIAGVAPDTTLLPFKAFTTADGNKLFEALDQVSSARPTVVLVDVPDGTDSARLVDKLKAIAAQGVSVAVGAGSGLTVADARVLVVGSGAGSAGPRGVAAPGQDILSTDKSTLVPTDPEYKRRSGTGQAAAHVAGALAILRGLGANPTQAADLLRSTARGGVIDIAAAAAAYQTPPAPATTTTKKAAAPVVPTTKATVSTVPAPGPAVPSLGGPTFDDPDTELGAGQEEAVAPPGLEEFVDDEGDRGGTSVRFGGRERPWVPLTAGFGLLFGVGSALSVTFRRLGAEPT